MSLPIAKQTMQFLIIEKHLDKGNGKIVLQDISEVVDQVEVENKVCASNFLHYLGSSGRLLLLLLKVYGPLLPNAFMFQNSNFRIWSLRL